MDSKEMLIIATGIAAGNVTEAELVEMNLDDNTLTTILEVATSLGAGVVASSIASSLLNTKLGEDICNVTDELVVEPVKEVLSDVGDVFDDINPFNW